MKIKLTSVLVDDPNKAHQFYTEILGFKSHTHMPEMKLAIVVSPEDPEGTALMLEPNEADFARQFQKTAYDMGMPFIVLGGKVQEEYERLSALGVKFQKAPTKTEWGTLAVFDDGFGNFIQIHEE